MKPMDNRVLDEFCRTLSEQRKNFVFKSIEMKGHGNQPWQPQPGDFSQCYLISRSQEIILWNTYLDLRCSRETLEECCHLRELVLHASTFFPPV